MSLLRERAFMGRRAEDKGDQGKGEGGKGVEEGAVISNAWKSLRPRGESNKGGGG